MKTTTLGIPQLPQPSKMTISLSNKTAKVKDLTEAYDIHFHAHALEEEANSNNCQGQGQDSHNSNSIHVVGPLNAPHTAANATNAANTTSSLTTTSSDQGYMNKNGNNDKSSDTNKGSQSESSLISKSNPPSSVEEIESTDAFRIQDGKELASTSGIATTTTSIRSNNPSITKTKTNDNHDSDQSHAQVLVSQSSSSSSGEMKHEGEPSSTTTTTTTTTDKNNSKTTTTLHFKSGLSLTISSDSESSKKVIASAGRITNNVPTTLPILPKLESSKNKSKQYDVDSLLHFSALNLTPSKRNTNSSTSNISSNSTSKSTSEDSKLTLKKNMIVQSKMTASRALSLQNSNSNNSNNSTSFLSSSSPASSQTTSKAGENLLQHICLVFTSALGLMKNTASSTPSTAAMTTTATSKGRKSLSGNNKTSNDSKLNNNNNVNDEQIELLTVDPMYLKKDLASGDEIKFLSDADYILDYELKKLGKASNDGVNLCRFLKDDNNDNSIIHNTDNTQLQSTTSCESKEVLHPEWFQHFNESEDIPIPATIVLLARIEQAIRESHHIYNKSRMMTLSSSSKSDCENSSIVKDNLNLVTPPSTPFRPVKGMENNTHDTINSSEDGSIHTSDNYLTSYEKGSSDEKSSSETEGSTINDATASSSKCIRTVPPPRFLSVHNTGEKTTKVDDSSFADFLGSWKNLHEQNQNNDVVKNVKRLIRGKTLDQCDDYAEKVLQSFSLKDLLLVPICSVLLIQPPASKLGVNQTLAYIRLLVTEWSHIITTGLTKVQKDLAKQQLSDLDDCLVADLDMLLDDNAVAKPGNGKKKKRKKKKKVGQIFVYDLVVIYTSRKA